MPLRNRVAPDGSIVATPERGTVYGNRGGCFHQDNGTLKARHWATRQWICCVLKFKGRRRTLLQPGKFTELFFLDEATAFAAGHRPCFECRRADAVRFQRFWAEAHGMATPPSAPDMDIALHAERLTSAGTKHVMATNIATLPDGTMFRRGGATWVVVGDAIRKWSFAGYGTAVSKASAGLVDVLTPAATLAVMRAGYHVQVHLDND